MPDTTPSRHFAQNEANALIHAALVRDTDEIDAITDRLAQQGVCRPRADMSRMAEWIARRPAEPAPVEFPDLPESSIGAELAAHFRGIFEGAAK